MGETPENFLRATSGFIHYCNLLIDYHMARTGDQWRPDEEDLIKDMAVIRPLLHEAALAASRLQHNMGRHCSEAYRAVFKVEPDQRTYEEWSKAQAEEMRKALENWQDED